MEMGKLCQLTDFMKLIYTLIPSEKFTHSFTSDINGDFLIRTIRTIRWLWGWLQLGSFQLAMSTSINVGDLYLQYNNYRLAEENRMIYNPSLEIYEGILLLKQGFYNYKFVEKDSEKLSMNSISGNHALTENNYLILVYYKEFGDRHDSLVGVGKTSSFEIVD